MCSGAVEMRIYVWCEENEKRSLRYRGAVSEMQCVLLITTVLFASSQAWQIALKANASRAPAERSARIVGGAPVNIKERPFVVQVQRNSQLVCGGTLLMSARLVLTAAQCFYNSGILVDNPASYNIQVGHSQMHSGSKYDVSKIIIHPEFTYDTLHADIALLLLSANVTLSESVQPIYISGGGFLHHTSIYLAGWGVPNPSNSLQQVAMSTMDPQQCYWSWQNAKVTLNTTLVFCVVSQSPAGACAGDVGGPAIVDADNEGKPYPIVVGVISRATCGEFITPTVVTNTEPYADWLEEMSEYHNSSPSIRAGGLLLTTLLASFLKKYLS